ncbi:hypothetical protein [Gilliamella apicola]|uniref:Uncharacterized protein n=3 Tax=Gilliamella apicola TaxID=1196095 RepID=A0A242NJB1_9GAMM|nr:hypothetical protein [Gilliamella apicola]OTP81613.1 hypothetical protein B5S40_10625 [Gilliamella apicola]OTP85728.1 hypothetical protein B5S44_04210 [Gilliamella apicola]OTP87922.1 hypothetical protein B5S42_09100 [Gilliamella apicola]OTQ00281.1 hypothetical protein B6D08_05100 [Gilliamella apicola]OTQ09329.1 hypothetical protein B6C91_09520 [Gilliamella apicola]
MSWPKPRVVNPLKPPLKLHRSRWYLFFIVLSFITTILLIIIWPNESYSSQWIFWISATIIPTTITGIAVSIRLYIYGLAQEEYEIWQLEQKNIDENWKNWAMKSLVILDSYYVLPNHLTVKDIINNGVNLPSKINKSLEFGDEFNIKIYLEEVFLSLSKLLPELSEKETININIYTSLESSPLLEEDINNAYQTAKLPWKYKLSQHISDNVNAEILQEMIDDSQTSLQLVIINNTISLNSAFLCAFLGTSKQHYQDLGINSAKVEILRPMVATELDNAIGQMIDMQHAIKQVKQVWFTNVEKKQQVEILTLLADQKISLDNQINLDSFIGNQTGLSYWLSLAMGCEMVMLTNQNNLMTAYSHNKWLLSNLAVLRRES